MERTVGTTSLRQASSQRRIEPRWAARRAPHEFATLLCMLALLPAGCEGTQRTFERGPNADVSEAVGGLDPRGPDTAQGVSPSNGAGAAEAPGSGEASAGQLQNPEANSAGAACSESSNADCGVLSALGQICETDDQCGSGFCTPDGDGLRRCCDSPCNGGQCERCSAAGQCGAVPVFATECPEISCPADDVCRDFEQAIAAGTCAEAGRCAGTSDCSFDWTEGTREGAACACTDAGCVLRAGEACTRNEDCDKNACRATAAGSSICCAQACAAGQVCSADGSGCELEPVCTDGQFRCSNGSYQLCTAGQWATQRECGSLGCDAALGGCRRSAGESCTTTADCGEGACRLTGNGLPICCTAACDTACKQCAATGTSCQFLNDDAGCGAIQCPADNTCRDYPAAVATNRCINGSCAAPVDLCGFTPRNSGQTCSNTSLCDQAGSCSVAKRALGSECSSAAECSSAQCVDGVCCESSCNGPCMACRPGTGLCAIDASCACPANSALVNGSCDCNPGRNLCSNGTTSSCVGNVFDFEGGSLQGWVMSTVSVPVPCGDAFTQCVQTFSALTSAGAHGGTGFAASSGTVLAGGVRRMAASVLLCGADGSTTTNLVGQRVSAFMQTGSQGGSGAGTTFSLSLGGRTGPPLTILTVSAATTGGAQNTGWIELSTVVPDSAVARAVVNVYLSLEIPGDTARSQGFQFDDVRIGE